MFPEEAHARALLRRLADHFARAAPAVDLSVTGGGTQTACVARRGGRACSVACFDLPGPQYSIDFQAGAETLARGRTSSDDEAVLAVSDWLDGGDVARLHRAFPFVDREPRALRALADEVTRLRPRLGRLAPPDLRRHFGDSYELQFAAGDRACAVSHFGSDDHPEAIFLWDEHPMFSFTADDPALLAAVLERWLHDRATPSQLRAEFPRVQPSAAAAY